MEENLIETNGGVPARIGKKFHTEIERIKKERIIKGKLKDIISTEKLTELIIRHKDWEKVSKDLIELSEEELKKIFK